MMPNLKLIERQIAMSDIRHRLEATAPRPGRYITKDGIAYGPCLMISRECGSGGSLLGQKVGELLGWNVFDSKIVDEIARVGRVQQQLVQTADEHTHSVWEQTWREYLLEDLPDKKYFRFLRQTVLALGHLGDVVMVGRGAQFLLPPQCGLRVRLVAPLDLRVQSVAANDKLSLEQARARVKAVDAERTAFISKNFHKEASSPLNHDVVINTGEIHIETAAQIILAMLRQKLGVEIQQNLEMLKEIHREASTLKD